MKYNLSDITKAVDWIITQLGNKKIILFDAPMGAGKTTLIAELCKSLGVMDKPSSPTFPIINQYHNSDGGVIYHFDCYRLKNEQEAVDLGIFDYLDSGSYCFIEWPDKISNLLPSNTVRIRIEAVDEQTREVFISK